MRKDDRNIAIIKDYESGMNVVNLVSKYKITSTRIYQLLKLKNKIKNKEINFYQKLVQKNKDLGCALCGTMTATEIHHIDRDRTNNSVENLTPLCNNCHRNYHEKEMFFIERKSFSREMKRLEARAMLRKMSTMEFITFLIGLEKKEIRIKKTVKRLINYFNNVFGEDNMLSPKATGNTIKSFVESMRNIDKELNT